MELVLIQIFVCDGMKRSVWFVLYGASIKKLTFLFI